jgi:hypothetical protein
MKILKLIVRVILVLLMISTVYRLIIVGLTIMAALQHNSDALSFLIGTFVFLFLFLMLFIWLFRKLGSKNENDIE